MQQLDNDPCILISAVDAEVRRSTDGGTTWHVVHHASAPVARVLASGLGADTVMLALGGTTAGAEISFDAGLRFTKAAGAEHLDVHAAYTAPTVGGRAMTTYIAGTPTSSTFGLPAAGPSVLYWDPQSEIFKAMLGSAHVRPANLVSHPSVNSTVWVDTHTGNSGALIQSADPGINDRTVQPFALTSSPLTGNIASIDVMSAPEQCWVGPLAGRRSQLGAAPCGAGNRRAV
jgi:hypothetical protein